MTDTIHHDTPAATSLWRGGLSWSSVLLGAVVAVAIGAMLNLLGVALGAASFDPYGLSGEDAGEFTAAAGAWMVIANAVALFIGAAIATRASRRGDDHRGGLHGLAVWAISFLLALILAGASLGGGVTSVLGGQAERVPADETFVVDILAQDGRAGDRIPVVPADDRAEAENAADATAMIALWAFLAMLVGAVASVMGGAYGARPHAWLDRFDRRRGAVARA